MNKGAKAVAPKYRPKSEQVRIIWGDGKFLDRLDHASESPDKVFAVIGPFDSHIDKSDLQKALVFVCRGFNTERR